jgi:ribosomal protein S18 acetylase RimI-like enzyme
MSAPFRRCGYAEKLARAAFVELARQGAHRIHLDVLVHNEQGLAFWRKLGLTLHHYVLEMPASR